MGNRVERQRRIIRQRDDAQAWEGTGEVAGAMELPAPDAAEAGKGGSIDEDGGRWSIL